MKKFLIKHVGNMGDMVFFIPPVLETLKRVYPGCHITFVTAWGFKDKKGRWGLRNQSGFCISLMMTNPHIDRLVHFHDTKLSLEADICVEEGQRFPTWNKAYFEKQKNSGKYDGVYELDFGLGSEDNPLTKMYQAVGLENETFSNYKIYLTDSDKAIGKQITDAYPIPRIVLLEGLEGRTTRGWDPAKVSVLEKAIEKKYEVKPIWFGGKWPKYVEGRQLSLRENIATLLYCDVSIGVMSGPTHFAGAVGLPTLTLFADQPLHRAAPAYFLNEYIEDEKKRHRTIVGPSTRPYQFLKNDTPAQGLTTDEKTIQGAKDWLEPGKQATKTALAVITVDEVMAVLNDMV